MGGVFLVWLIPLLLLIGLALAIFYFSLRRNWSGKDVGKSPLELALEQERQESEANPGASVTDART